MEDNRIIATNSKRRNTREILVIISFLLVVISVLPKTALAAEGSIYLAPSKGTFLVGSTFSISIFTDTKGNNINAIQVDLSFPADRLQITSPTAGESFVSEWLTPPTYSNTGGFINFKGGIKEGITASAGLVSTITFRAKSPGLAKIELLDSSKILLNDGKGTAIPTLNFGGSYEILVPPPEGPKISSNTHQDSSIWYLDSDPIFFWGKKDGVTDFSFILSQNPQEIPDTIAETSETSMAYSNVGDGVWYFHLRAQENKVWGRASHFGVRIDVTPPEYFDIKLNLSSLISDFSTRDVHSGIDHYEVSISNIGEDPITSSFFIETVSPFRLPYESPGRYSMVVRVYDRAGNIQTSETAFRIISPWFAYIDGKGVEIKGVFLSWWLLSSLLLVIAILIFYIIYYLSVSRVGFRKGIKEIGEAIEEIEKIERKERESQGVREKFIEEKRKLDEKLR